jgi:hypothetical protein
MMTTNPTYLFYLFCKLKDVYLPSEEPYDISFDIDRDDYYNFLASTEFFQEKSDHDCICDYFINKQQQ